jgi:dihydrofolate synthase/folylpolyglutamate synthase
VVDPLVSVITTLSYDHMAVLGDTLAKIAGEKAGIIKPGWAVVSAPQKDEALRVIQETAAECGAPLRLRVPLLGRHQVENAATAYAALEAAREQGLQIEDEAICRGFSQVVWPGRFELLRREPPVLVDSAHNADSALKLRLALEDYFPGRPVVLLFGASEDKDIRGMLEALLPRVQRVIATQAVHPRAMSAEQIVSLVHEYGCPAQAVVPMGQALLYALEAAREEAVVVAAGSLFVAAAAREAWHTVQPECALSALKGASR